MPDSFHEKLVARLHRQLQQGAYAPGAKFLTEREIATRFRTSRPTANKALHRLVSEGLLEVRRGAGTFVSDGVLDYDMQRLVSFTEKARAAGKEPSTRLLRFRRTSAARVLRPIAQALGLTGTDPVFVMERLRLAGGRPVIFERRHVAARLCPEMTRDDASGSLYDYWTRQCRLTITGADEVITAVNASATEAAHLDIAVGSACLRVTAVGTVSHGKVLWYEQTLYRSDCYEFRSTLSGLRRAAATRPVSGRVL
jgi:GntR family transcriptional regulator